MCWHMAYIFIYSLIKTTSHLCCGCVYVCLCLFFTGHLHLKGSVEKMSKSLKNYITIKVILFSVLHSFDNHFMFSLYS
uniref:Uncharacterized protein n=1 Tax=Anguilla anguilla TaxID=7936 RepID=A0A0E9UI60_ANGAN